MISQSIATDGLACPNGSAAIATNGFGCVGIEEIITRRVQIVVARNFAPLVAAKSGDAAVVESSVDPIVAAKSNDALVVARIPAPSGAVVVAGNVE